MFIQILDFIGTFAFAISGIRLASAKHFDLLGAYCVGLTTAIGGGTMRDLLLSQPPFWMTNSFYLICTGFALIWVIIDDWRLSSMKTKVSSSIKPDFRYKRSFLSIAGAKVQQFGVENKFWGYRFFRGICKCLTDSTLQ